MSGLYLIAKELREIAHLGQVKTSGLLKRTSNVAFKLNNILSELSAIKAALTGDMQLMVYPSADQLATTLNGAVAEAVSNKIAVQLVSSKEVKHCWCNGLKLTITPVAVVGSGAFDAPSIDDTVESYGGGWLLNVIASTDEGATQTYAADSEYGFDADLTILGYVLTTLEFRIKVN